MDRRPLKTYGKNPNSNRAIPAVPKHVDYRHNVFDTSDSEDNILKPNDKDQSITDNPFESTFDKIAKTAKLPPLPLTHSPNNSILYVSSSSSSSLSDENWIQNIEKGRQNPPKKITNRKRRKKTDPDKKKNIERIRVKKTQTTNRKRQNNLQIVNNVEVSPPQRKTRRSSNEHATLAIDKNSDDSDINPSSAISSPSTNELKSCCVELTRVQITEPHLETDEKSHPSIVNSENNNCDEHSIINKKISPIPSVNQHAHKFTNMRDCRIVLSRLDVNSVVPSKISSPNPKMMSSTPFNRRILPLNMKPSFSPINDKPNDTINISSTNGIEELSEICKPYDDTTNSTKLGDSLIEKSSTEQSMNLKDIPTHSHTYINPPQDNKIKLFLIDDEKSTKLLFETNDSINDINDIAGDMSNESHSEQTMDMMKMNKIHANPLSSSPDDNKSRSMFGETQLQISNVDDNSISCTESYGNTFAIEKSSIDKSETNDKIMNDTMSSEMESIESNISLISRTGQMDTINTVDSSNNNTSSNESLKASNKDTSEDSYRLLISNSSSNNNSPGTNPMESTDSKIIDSDRSSLSVTKVDDELENSNTTEPIVLLRRLSDPVKITKRRGKYVNWDCQLGTISESLGKRTSISVHHLEDELSMTQSNTNENSESSGEASVLMKNIVPRLSRRKRTSVQNKSRHTEHDESHNNDEIKMVFLKPGKSWARSLSILNHINNNDDIEMLSIGKGKKWRQSVKNVLDMQSQGVLQSCVKNKENENDERAVSYGIRRSDVTRISSSTIAGTVESTSPGRFVRRVSIRVVPDKKYSRIEDKDMRDTSFLEVYGISRSKNRKTSESRSTSIARRDTLVYNLRCSKVNIPAAIPDPVVAARDVVLQRCNQTDSILFEECYPETFLNNCRKIGEGVYGEVFLFENRKEKSVIKIIPIEGEKLVNGEPQKKFCEILSEIIIAKELHNLRFHNVYRTSGFIEVKNIRFLIGKYPQKLIEHWQAYDEEKTSDNDCPSMFTDDQLYIALELAHGGNDLEAFVFQNANEAYTSFVQAALTLAVAEKSLDFEHRDLHWGNILISRTNDIEMSYKLDTEEVTFPCKGLKVAIIDFTLSRMSYQGCCMFNDLALDPALFTAVGEYQFEIYRLMKGKVGNNWQLFEPYTNILWLHYTLDKMITSVRYKKNTTKIHRNGILKLQELKNELLNYDSAYDFITNCDKLSGLQRRSSSS